MRTNPLLCWDIVKEGQNRRVAFAKDIHEIQKLSTTNHWVTPVSMAENALLWENKVILITNHKLRIVYATHNIANMNGYTLPEVVGQSPKMFQGVATSLEDQLVLLKAINSYLPFNHVITNYRKNGSLYKCNKEAYPVRNKYGKVVHYMALENVAV